MPELPQEAAAPWHRRGSAGWAGRADGRGRRGEGPSVASSEEGARRRVMSAFPSGSVMCACQVNSLEIDGRKAADGACSRAGGALPSPFPPRCRPRRRLPRPSVGRWEQRRAQRRAANPRLSSVTALKRDTRSGGRCRQVGGGSLLIFQAAGAAGLLHPLPCWGAQARPMRARGGCRGVPSGEVPRPPGWRSRQLCCCLGWEQVKTRAFAASREAGLRLKRSQQLNNTSSGTESSTTCQEYS